MAHLTCIKHGRRVLYNETAIIHRNGDGSKCAVMDSSLDILMLTNAKDVNESRLIINTKLLSVSFEKFRNSVENTVAIFNKFTALSDDNQNQYLHLEDEAPWSRINS